MSHSFFKLAVDRLENEKNIVYVRPWVMFPFMPALRAVFKGFIIAILALLYNPFDTDITTDFIPKMIALKQKKQP